jgi:hypothetical protein
VTALFDSFLPEDPDEDRQVRERGREGARERGREGGREGGRERGGGSRKDRSWCE